MNRQYQALGKSRVTRRTALTRGFAAGLGVATLVTVGCGDDDDDTDGNTGDESPQPTSEGITYQKDATLRAGVGTDIGSLDPQSVAGTGGGNFANQFTHFANGLLTTDPETSTLAGFVADYEWTDNNAALLLKVKPGITFHNGEPVDAAAVKFSLDRARGKPEYTTDFKSGQTTLYKNVDRVEALDATTVKIVMSKPDVSLPTKLTGTPYLVPRQYVTSQGDANFANKPIGSGPFKFVSRQVDTEIVSERFDEFWNKQDAKYGPRVPYIKSLVQRVLPEPAARALAVEAGELDIAVDIPPDLAKSYANRSGFQAFYLPNDQPMHVQPNTLIESAPNGDPNPFRDVRVRRAMNMAVDVDTIIETILTGKEKYSFGFSSQTLGFPKERLEQARFKYDPAQAKALLDQAGFSSGFEVPFVGPAARYPQSDAVMEAVAGYLGKVGIRTKVSTAQYQSWVTEHQAGKWYGLSFLGVAGGIDPSANFSFGYVRNSPYGKSYDVAIGVDEAFTTISSTFDEQERAKLIGDTIFKLYDNATWLYLYEPVGMAIANDKVDWQPYARVLAFPEYWNVRLKA